MATEKLMVCPNCASDQWRKNKVPGVEVKMVGGQKHKFPIEQIQEVCASCGYVNSDPRKENILR